MLELNQAEQQFFTSCLEMLLQETALQTMDDYMQHGETSCLWHSIAVAHYSYRLMKSLRLRCDEKSLICGALLHDYFLYDWHVPNEINKLHGFRHPGIALENAKRDRSLTKIERDIIARHMFPLTPKPPRFRESIVVCLVDKVCSLAEVFRRRPYGDLRAVFAPAGPMPFRRELLHDTL